MEQRRALIVENASNFKLITNNTVLLIRGNYSRGAEESSDWWNILTWSRGEFLLVEYTHVEQRRIPIGGIYSRRAEENCDWWNILTWYRGQFWLVETTHVELFSAVKDFWWWGGWEGSFTRGSRVLHWVAWNRTNRLVLYSMLLVRTWICTVSIFCILKYNWKKINTSFDYIEWKKVIRCLVCWLYIYCTVL